MRLNIKFQVVEYSGRGVIVGCAPKTDDLVMTSAHNFCTFVSSLASRVRIFWRYQWASFHILESLRWNLILLYGTWQGGRPDCLSPGQKQHTQIYVNPDKRFWISFFIPFKTSPRIRALFKACWWCSSELRLLGIPTVWAYQTNNICRSMSRLASRSV